MDPHEISQLREMGRLLSHLYLREVTAGFIEELDAIGANETLRDLGISLPDGRDAQSIERLATEYFETLVAPKDLPPPIQSIVIGGTYEGDAARSMREIAKAVGVTFDPKVAGGAPVDHLGSQLALWSDLMAENHEVATEFAVRHLVWAKPLLRHQAGESFYGNLAQVTLKFIEVLEAR
ncbi:MAG: TorA maturation chaperone TorD [Planctomycetota bacterium]|jgi:TorA maturation chaperone TorD